MPVTATTADDLVSALAAQVLRIVPTVEEYQGQGWKYVPGYEVEGAEVRTFDIIADPEQVADDGIWDADGVEYDIPIRVVATYGGVPPQVARKLLSSDGKDLELAFTYVIPTTAGLVSIRPAGIEQLDVAIGEAEDLNERDRFVAVFIFTARYKGRNAIS